MDRDEMIESIVVDMEKFLERDANSFWEHVRDMERRYLKAMEDNELSQLYADIK